MKIFSGIQCLGLLPKLLSLHQGFQGFLGATAVLMKVRTNRTKIGFVACPSQLLTNYLFLLIKEELLVIAPGLLECLFRNTKGGTMQHIHLHIGLLFQIGFRIKSREEKILLLKGPMLRRFLEKLCKGQAVACFP